MAERDKELQLLEKRFAELADRAWQQKLFVFTGFLSLAEQEVLWRSAAKAGVHIELYGGMDGAERCMGRFGDPEEFGYEEPFPICAVKIEPLAEKFAENFSHRDFMGAILNLGIDRSTIGDICVEGKCAYVFCTSAMSVFLQETLEQVRHTKVRCVPVEKLEALPEKKLSYREEHVASLRCDGIVSAVWRLSRSQGQTLFSQKKVFVNGRLTENGSQMLKDGDTVSVRGFGKFIFRGEKNTTKKGRLVIGADLFV